MGERSLEVSGFWSERCPADLVDIVFQHTSVKESAEDARQCASKHVQYIQQTVRQRCRSGNVSKPVSVSHTGDLCPGSIWSGVDLTVISSRQTAHRAKENAVPQPAEDGQGVLESDTVHAQTSHGSASRKPTACRTRYRACGLVHCRGMDVSGTMNACNILRQKIGKSLTIRQPVNVYVDQEICAEYCQSAMGKALEAAKRKAEKAAHRMHARLGPLVSMREEVTRNCAHSVPAQVVNCLSRSCLRCAQSSQSEGTVIRTPKELTPSSGVMATDPLGARPACRVVDLKRDDVIDWVGLVREGSVTVTITVHCSFQLLDASQ